MTSIEYFGRVYSDLVKSTGCFVRSDSGSFQSSPRIVNNEPHTDLDMTPDKIDPHLPSLKSREVTYAVVYGKEDSDHPEYLHKGLITVVDGKIKTLQSHDCHSSPHKMDDSITLEEWIDMAKVIRCLFLYAED